MHIVISLAVFALLIGALIDIITRGDHQVKHLPKIAWVLLVVLLPLLGSVLWFTLGREYSERPLQVQTRHSGAPAAAPTPSLSTEQQLAQLEREIAAYEELERIRHLEAEIERRRRERQDEQ